MTNMSYIWHANAPKSREGRRPKGE